jgi:5-methylthioadenosine/S-adenosylhomocysteine deaminase
MDNGSLGSEVTVVRGAHVLTMGSLGDLVGAGVAFDRRSGLILNVAPWADLEGSYAGAEVVGSDDDIVTPGFVNAHDHLSEGLISGLGETMSLYEWSRRLIGRVAPLMNREYAHAGALVKGAEMALSGITCVNDMFVHANPGSKASLGSVDGLEEIGLRSVVAFGAQDKLIPISESSILEEHDLLAQRCSETRLCSFRIGIAAMHAQGDSLLRASVDLARHHEWQIHTHLAEVREEITDARLAYGTNTLGRARDFGVLDVETIYAHCVWLTEPDVSDLAGHPAAVAHNPVSNMILGSGVCPVPRLRAAGVRVGLGTDGAGSNDSHDMLQVLKVAALLQKIDALDPSATTARDVITMGTIEGARALCLDHEIGSLEPGKMADIVHFSADSARLAYVHDPYQQLVYGAAPADVANVWVGGRRIVRDHALASISEKEVVSQARPLARDLFKRAGLDDVLQRDRRVNESKAAAALAGART